MKIIRLMKKLCIRFILVSFNRLNKKNNMKEYKIFKIIMIKK